MSKPKVILSRASDNKWENKGLRSFLEYRDLGIVEATDGKFGGSIARALHAKKATDHAALHYHTLGFHLTLVTRGWMRTYYDGLGEVILKAGDCVTYMGEVVQSHTEHSDDFEVLQITMPNEFPTVQVEDKSK
jgi:mannose-6-phosphate isomerase-like protein (cupin superfamily)